MMRGWRDRGSIDREKQQMAILEVIDLRVHFLGDGKGIGGAFPTTKACFVSFSDFRCFATDRIVPVLPSFPGKNEHVQITGLDRGKSGKRSQVRFCSSPLINCFCSPNFQACLMTSFRFLPVSFAPFSSVASEIVLRSYP